MITLEPDEFLRSSHILPYLYLSASENDDSEPDDSLSSEIEITDDEISLTESEKNEINALINDEYDSQIQALKDKLSNEENEQIKIQNELQQITKDTEKLKQEIENMKNEKRKNKQELSGKNEQINKLHREIEEAQSVLSTFPADYSYDNLKNLMNSMIESLNEIGELIRRLDEFSKRDGSDLGLSDSLYSFQNTVDQLKSLNTSPKDHKDELPKIMEIIQDSLENFIDCIRPQSRAPQISSDDETFK